MRLRSRLTALAVVTALVASLMTLVPPAGIGGQAAAADASDFDPGFLVSDQQFYDGGAMTAGEVQAFIDAKHETCASGYTCIDTYAQRTPSMPADDYCDAVPGRDRESAASIIARVGQACDISQRYLLVLLQKEQGLITHPSPNARRYAAATGFGCPDTAPCDSGVAGFFYQIYYGARQFQRYKAHPTWWAHRAGVRNWVWWHPNHDCGYSPIHIRNAATAGLYNYTPYRPNQAALDNLYSTGDSCSSYGNRNTWRIWTDWFGDPTLTLPSAKRIYGADRYQTSVAVSRSEFGSGVPVAYVASGEKFPDGIAAGAAAAHQGGPVLLTQQSTLTPSVRDELVRLQPRQVVIVGDEQSISTGVERAIRALMPGGGTAAALTEEAAASPTPSAAPTVPPTAEPAPTGEPLPTDEPLEPTSTPDPAATETAPEPETTPTPAATEAAPDEPAEAGATEAEAETLAQPAASTAPVLRIGGANRYATSRLIAEHAFGSASSAFVATGLRFPDALAAGPAAARRGGPVLLVNGTQGTLDSATRATLQRLGTSWVGVVGNTDSVSAGIATGLDATGAQVTRYAGSNRYETAARLAAAFGDVDTAYVASGNGFADALSGAAVAGAQGAPLLLTLRTCMPEQTRSALIRAMPDEVVVLGGTPTISSSSARYVSC